MEKSTVKSGKTNTLANVSRKEFRFRICCSKADVIDAILQRERRILILSLPRKDDIVTEPKIAGGVIRNS